VGAGGLRPGLRRRTTSARTLDSYNHPNAAIEPRIPGIFQYYSVAEDELAKGFAGQYASAQETADAIAAAWERITDQIGRDSQIALYKASLGL
jgi:multiple sugar transport system substrate-binding protein